MTKINEGNEKLTAVLQKARDAESAGNNASAFELFRLAYNLEPSRLSAAYRAALNLIEVGRISDAEAFLNKVLSDPKGKKWLVELALGQIRTAQFRPEEAEAHFRRARELNRASTSPAVLLADCLFKQEKFEEAKAVLLEAVHCEGDLDEVFLNLGLVMRAQGHYESAKAYLMKALEISPEYDSAKVALADVEMWLNAAERSGSA